MAVDPRGALLIADDLSNTIWRVTPNVRRPLPKHRRQKLNAGKTGSLLQPHIDERAVASELADRVANKELGLTHHHVRDETIDADRRAGQFVCKHRPLGMSLTATFNIVVGAGYMGCFYDLRQSPYVFLNDPCSVGLCPFRVTSTYRTRPTCSRSGSIRA